jgi:hypothetical protein
MNSSFKPFYGLFLASLVILIIETILFVKIGKKEIVSNSIKSALFDNKFRHEDASEKSVLRYKVDLFLKAKAEFTMVGDSSGFFGVRPTILKEYLGDKNFSNISCCATVRWDGYALIADHFLSNNNNAEYLVLYVNPYSLPMVYKGKGDTSALIKGAFGNSGTARFFKLFHYIPSLYYREHVQNFIYRKEPETLSKKYERFLHSIGTTNFEKVTNYKTAQLIEYIQFSGGWLPLTINKQSLLAMPRDLCDETMLANFYGEDGRPTLNKYLLKIKKVADSNNVKMIVMFNPVSCKISEEIQPVVDDLDLFKQNNPEVYIPFNFITTWDEDEFSDQWHVSPEASIRNSHRVGKALEKIIKKSS